jgi:hypothetical protein
VERFRVKCAYSLKMNFWQAFKVLTNLDCFASQEQLVQLEGASHVQHFADGDNSTRGKFQLDVSVSILSSPAAHWFCYSLITPSSHYQYIFDVTQLCEFGTIDIMVDCDTDIECGTCNCTCPALGYGYSY